MEKGRFHNQVAVVTGGAQGIGFATAKQMALEGAKIIIWDIANAHIIAKTLDCDALGLKVDVASEDSIDAALKETIKEYGQIDVLVTAAGIAGPYGPVQDQDLDDWERVLRVNLTGTFLSCRAVLREMLKRNYGRIVTLASVAGKTGTPNISAYATAKAGIIGFTKSLGKELVEKNIRVNTITPGLIDTPLMAQLGPEQIKIALSTIPQGRFGTVEECASMITFMASNECSFNSGAVFDLSGGAASY